MRSEPADASRRDFVSEEEAHLVLARAVELDTRAVSDVSVAQLRAVAAEAGIAPDALDRALDELRAGRLANEGAAAKVLRPRSGHLRRFRRHVALAVAIGVAAATPGDHVGSFVLVALPLYALYELCIRLVATRERGGRSSPAPRAQDPAISDENRRTGRGELPVRRLSLRLTALAQA